MFFRPACVQVIKMPSTGRGAQHPFSWSEGGGMYVFCLLRKIVCCTVNFQGCKRPYEVWCNSLAHFLCFTLGNGDLVRKAGWDSVSCLRQTSPASSCEQPRHRCGAGPVVGEVRQGATQPTVAKQIALLQFPEGSDIGCLTSV